MTQEQFLEKLMDIMDCESELTLDTNLSDIEEWDSLSYISFLAFTKANGQNIDPTAAKMAKTIKDLYELVK